MIGPDNIILVTAMTPYNFLWPINAVFVWLLPLSMLFWVRKVLNENSVYPRVDDRSENFETFFNKGKQQMLIHDNLITRYRALSSFLWVY